MRITQPDIPTRAHSRDSIKCTRSPCSSQIVMGTRCDQDDGLSWALSDQISPGAKWLSRQRTQCVHRLEMLRSIGCSRSSEWFCIAGGSKVRGGANSTGIWEDLKDKSVDKNDRTVIAGHKLSLGETSGALVMTATKKLRGLCSEDLDLRGQEGNPLSVSAVTHAHESVESHVTFPFKWL